MPNHLRIVSPRRARQRGNAVVEMAFMMPWIAFLFVGILDFGFYSYAAIATQNAARTAAIQAAAADDVTGACQAALNELKGLPNMSGVVTCAATPGAVTNALPVAVCATVLNNTASGACSSPAVVCADCTLNASATSAQVVVTYQSIPMIPIPGLLTAQMRLTRIAEARMIE
jgi:Flp pilus assembly protein TadG